jgi:hypothetical protein
MYHEVGGFGTLVALGFDYSTENPTAWHESLQALATEVMPKVQHLKPKPVAQAAE